MNRDPYIQAIGKRHASYAAAAHQKRLASYPGSRQRFATG